MAEESAEKRMELQRELVDTKASLKSICLSELRYRRVFECARDGILILNADSGRIEDVSPFMSDLLGYSYQELVGRSIWEIGLFEDIEQSKAAFRELQEKGYIRYEDMPLVDKKGVHRQVEFVSNVYHVGDGKAIQCNIRDITERKLAERTAVRLDLQLQEQAKQLANEARHKDEFLAVLSHELRNPLAPIRNGIDVLRRLPPDSERAKTILDMMEEQAVNLVRLTDDLLDVSRFAQGKMELKREPTALLPIINSAIQTADPLIHANNHELTVRQSRESLFVDGDPTRLKQVIANLLNNAAKYTPKGGNISLSVEREGDVVAIHVRDNGIGISASVLPGIFGMYFQVDSSLHRSQGGLGIGLTLVKSLVELHGGSVEAQSAGLGQGCEFTVRLPLLEEGIGDRGSGLKDSNSYPPLPKLSIPDSNPCPPIPNPSIRSRRVLIVDDVQPIAMILALFLQSYGQSVRTAASGAEALMLMEKERPDLVFSDISMPDMTGYELARKIRQRPEWSDISLVAVTGYGQLDDKRLASEAGFNSHVIKPIRKEDIEQILRQ